MSLGPRRPTGAEGPFAGPLRLPQSPRRKALALVVLLGLLAGLGSLVVEVWPGTNRQHVVASHRRGKPVHPPSTTGGRLEYQQAMTLLPSAGANYVDVRGALQHLRDDGANWVYLAPTWSSPGPCSSTIHPVPGLTPPDAQVDLVTSLAERLGLHVALEPLLTVERGLVSSASIDPRRQGTWWRAYDIFIEHYVDLAIRAHASEVVIGTALPHLSTGTARWVELIGTIRHKYSGLLTYGALGDEYERVRFWPELDAIGIDAAWTLSPVPTTVVGRLVNDWYPVMEKLADTAARWHKPVVFTRVAFANAFGPVLTEPGPAALPAPVEQAAAYDALLTVARGEPWLRGLDWWAWTAETPTRLPTSTSPAAAAEGVLRSFWTATGGAPSVAVTAFGTAAARAIAGMIAATLQGEIAHGYNAGVHGLWVNWRAGPTRDSENFNGTGYPDALSGGPVRHDPATDLRFLHTLLAWEAEGQGSAAVQHEISLFETIVLKEFTGTQDLRGWYYDELTAIGTLSGDSRFTTVAYDLASAYARDFNPRLGAIIESGTRFPTGFYRSDWALEEGAALVEAGARFDRPKWAGEGKAAIAFVTAHAFVKGEGTFLHALTDVVTPGGRANRDEVISRSGGTNGDGTVVQPSEVAQDAVALLEAGYFGADAGLVLEGESLLRAFSPEQDQLGLWDRAGGGYYENGDFAGPSFFHPGAFAVKAGKKDSDQLAMLMAFHLADELDSRRPFVAAEAQLLDVAQRLYEPAEEGFPFEVRTDWGLVRLAGCNCSEDWVTAEADGVALEALESLDW